MSNLQVASTIIEQMGGMRRLRAMVAAHNVVGGDNFVMFSFKGSRKASKCRITLTADDLYTFELFKLKGKYSVDFTVIHKEEGLYWDMLKPEFERETGLYLSL